VSHSVARYCGCNYHCKSNFKCSVVNTPWLVRERTHAGWGVSRHDVIADTLDASSAEWTLRARQASKRRSGCRRTGLHASLRESICTINTAAATAATTAADTDARPRTFQFKRLSRLHLSSKLFIHSRHMPDNSCPELGLPRADRGAVRADLSTPAAADAELEFGGRAGPGLSTFRLEIVLPVAPLAPLLT
jgi:hypothetical protein